MPLFYQAINPLLAKFGIQSSVGYTIDPEHHIPGSSQGWIVYSEGHGLLNMEHPIVKGRNESERINKVATFGASALSEAAYTNIFQMSETAEIVMHHTGVDPTGTGNSQALAGKVGKGKVLAFGDANGFVAMQFKKEEGALNQWE
jgi:hypothetical protein